MKLIFALLASALTLPTAACNDDGVAPLAHAELSILFVGNSLTMSNDLPDMVAALLDSVGAGPTLVLQETAPGTGLEDHWAWGSALAEIRTGNYDYVVLQQGPSATEGRPSLLEYAKRFGDEIRAAGSRPALYMVWPAASRDFDFDGVSDSYRAASVVADGLLLPAGDVWRAAWARDAALQLYGGDGFHPSELGSYAAALTMAVVFSGRPASDFPRRFALRSGWVVDIDAESAATIAAAVTETVEALGSATR